MEDIKQLLSILVGLIIIAMIVINSDTSNIDNAIKCKSLKNHICTRYEIEKLEI